MEETMETGYVGIDYGLGRSNVDLKTGIRFGVISQHAVSEAWCDSAEPDYGEPTCGKCGNPAQEGCIDDEPDYPEWDDEGMDYFCRDCKRSFNSEDAFRDEPLGWSFEDSEYTLTDCLDSDVFVLKSPYYTFAQFCSPCVPGAGNLDTPVSNGVKTYALGHDWFEDGKAPYTVYRIADDVEVLPD